MSLFLVIGSDQGMTAAAVIEIFWSVRFEKDLNHQHALCVFDSPLFAADNSFGRTAPVSVAKAISDAAERELSQCFQRTKSFRLVLGHWFVWVEIVLWLDRWQNYRLCC